MKNNLNFLTDARVMMIGKQAPEGFEETKSKVLQIERNLSQYCEETGNSGGLLGFLQLNFES